MVLSPKNTVTDFSQLFVEQNLRIKLNSISYQCLPLPPNEMESPALSPDCKRSPVNNCLHLSYSFFQSTVIPLYPQRIHFRTPSRFLKPHLMLPRHIHTYFFTQWKLGTNSFSLTYLNFQHHYSCALGPLSSKIRVLEHKHCDTTTA